MAYGIHETRRKLRELSGDLVLVGRKRVNPTRGRGYWVKQYQVELPGKEPKVVDEFLARMMSDSCFLDKMLGWLFTKTYSVDG